MTCEEAIAYIHSNHWTGRRPGLDRIRELLAKMGNPQKSLRFIHVAGTNGKGSTCAMLDSVLRAAGYRVGLFTSPYIRRFEERMRMDGEMISGEELAAITEDIRKIADTMEEKPTEFELITAIGFAYFLRHRAEIVVLEVGLGGRLDPTNIIDAPLLSVITGIDFDHMEQLGNTIQAIAAEKAGIVKEGCPVLFGGAEDSACRTIRTVANARHSRFYTVDRSSYRVVSATLDGTVFDFKDYQGLEISLLGSYQPVNAATALTAIGILCENGLTVSDEAIRTGLRNTRWPARFELLSRDPVVITDGGHNPQGISAAIRSIKHYFPEQKVNILCAIMADKDYDEMIEKLRAVTAKAYTATPSNPRALKADELCARFWEHKVEAQAFDSVAGALSTAIAESRAAGTPLICLGSLYLYSEIMNALEADKTVLA